MHIFSHITLGVNQIDQAIAFYDAVLSTLGLTRHSRGESFAGYSYPDDTHTTGENSLWILSPANGQAAGGANGTNIALRAATPADVQAFHATALARGATDEGAPGLRPDIHPHFYACYIRDPDGNKLVAVCHEPQ